MQYKITGLVALELMDNIVIEGVGVNLTYTTYPWDNGYITGSIGVTPMGFSDLNFGLLHAKIDDFDTFKAALDEGLYTIKRVDFGIANNTKITFRSMQGKKKEISEIFKEAVMESTSDGQLTFDF